MSRADDAPSGSRLLRCPSPYVADHVVETESVGAPAFDGCDADVAVLARVADGDVRDTSVNIRGPGSTVSVCNGGREPAVGVYVDQVHLARPGRAVFDLVGIDRVEVLRGPRTAVSLAPVCH